jgi:hypothetical protein
MKKARTEQTITIKIPVDPTLPAEVEFTPGPYAEEAKRLAATPGSGWNLPSTRMVDYYVVDPSGKQAPIKLNAVPIPLFFPNAKNDDPRIRFLVDRKIIEPKPLRKPRPDAAAYLNKHRKEKKDEAEKEKQKEGLEAYF